MNKIIISKKAFSNFILEKVEEYRDIFFINLQQEQKSEELEDPDLYEAEDYFIGVDIDGELIFTDASSYIEFSKTVFFLTLDDEFLENFDPDFPPYSTDKALNDVKELIQIYFKQRLDEDVEIIFSE